MGEKKPKMKRISRMTEGQEDLLGGLTGFLQEGVGEGAAAFPGDLTAGIIELETGGLAKLGEFVDSETPSILGEGESTLSRMLNIDPTAIESRFRELEVPGFERIQEERLANIREEFVGSGFMGTPRLESVARAETAFGQDLSSMLAGKFESAEDRALQALGITPAFSREIEEAPLRRAVAGIGLGGLERELEQAGIARELQEFIRTLPENSPLLPIILSALGISAFDTGVTPGQPSPFAGLAGGIGAGIGTAVGGPIGGAIGGGISSIFN